MKHPLSVEGYDGSLRELAQAIGKMRYDRVAEFLGEFAEEFERQHEGDKAKGRARLAVLLKTVSEELELTQKQVEKIWHLCEPYMRDEEHRS